jgi:uncharacterized repeat protein (TIGR01451 family)
MQLDCKQSVRTVLRTTPGKPVGRISAALPVLAAVLFWASCGGSSSSGPHIQAPILTYTATTAVYTKGTAITPDTPSNSGGAATSYSVTPALPAGLALDTTTGIISGTPTVVAAQATYTVTGTNAGGNGQVALTITVNDIAPAGLTYSTNPATYSVAAPITPNAPSVSGAGGAPTGFAVTSGALPQGLAIDPVTGIISGTPGAQAAQANYTITASNSGGSTTATLTLTVIPQAPYIVLEPVNQYVGSGISTYFAVSAGGGGGTLTYQWYEEVNGVPTAVGTNSSVYATPVLSSTDTGERFYVIISDAYNRSVPSSKATLIVQGASGTFVNTGTPSVARECATATLLQNGRVLIVGGRNGNTALASAELYHPFSGTFSSTGSLATERCAHTATLLNDGTVLIVGGYNFGSTSNSGLPSLASAELYDPATGTFSATGSLVTSRSGHSATLLANGQVLIAGGDNSVDGFTNTILASAELYDPIAKTFSPTGSLATPRSAPAVLLGNGQVLIAGGSNFTSGPLSSAELYDPIAGTFSATGSLNTARDGHTATLLSNGQVLIAGGDNSGGTNFLSSAELYDPVATTFTSTGSLNNQRENHTATVLQSGQVLIVGGNVIAIAQPSLNMSELYDSTVAAGVFIFDAPTNTPRVLHTATLLKSGKVLVTGQATSALTVTQPAPAELYQP